MRLDFEMRAGVCLGGYPLFHLIRVRFDHPPAGFPKECLRPLRRGRLIPYPMYCLIGEGLSPVAWPLARTIPNVSPRSGRGYACGGGAGLSPVGLRIVGLRILLGNTRFPRVSHSFRGGLSGGGDGQFIAAVIEGVFRVAFDPVKRHVVRFTERQQLFP